MAFSDLEIRNAWEDSLAAGFTPEQIYQGALANFGVTRDQVDRALANTSNISNQQVQELFQAPPATPRTVTTSSGQVYNYDDVVNLINARYAEGKTPALAVKSALQLGFPEDVIRTLPGVDAAAFEEGKRLIESGAFASTATGTAADIQQAAPVGSAQYNARIAAGLDAFGFPPEEVARLTAAGLYGPGKQYDPGTGGLLSQVQDVLATSQAGYNPEMAYTPVGQFQVDGKTVTVNPDGSYYALEELGGGNIAQQVYSPAGELVDQSVYNREESTYLTPVVNALMAAAGGAVLGPAGSGLLSTPAAAAVGSGGTTLARGGDIESALKSAALAGLTAYGIQGLMGGGAGTETLGAEELNVYDDIRQLKAAGIPDSQIAQIVEISYNATPEFAASAINQVASSTAAPVATETVALESSRLFNPATLAAPAIAALPSTFVAEPVTVQGQNLPQSQVTVQDLLAALTPELVAPLPAATGSGTQTVEIPGSKTTATENIISSLVPALTTAAIPAATQAATQSTAPERVEVTAKKDTSLIPSLGAAVTAALPTIPADIKAELPKPLQPTEKSLFTPSDLLKLIGLLGGAGAGAALSGTGAGTGVGTLPPSDTRIASTTPQYGSDYYNAVQRYYNAYMPETPRDVAGPLQQWYENTYGTAPATGPGVGSAPAVIPGGMFTTPQVTTPTQPGPDRGITPVRKPQGVAPQTSKQQSFMGPEYFQALLENPQYGSQVYGAGIQPIGGLPPGLSQEALAKLFPQGTSKYIPQEVSVSIPDYFGYIVGTPEFDTLLERARAAQRAFSSAGTGQYPADQEYALKNYLNNLAGGMAMTGGVNQGAKPLLPLLTSLDTSSGRMTSEQADALQFIVSNAENYNRLKQDIPVWEKEGNTAYLASQKPYFEQLGKALRDYSKKLEGLDPSKLSSKELFSFIPSGI